MPWKSGYTISDERSLADAEVRWPEGRRCAVHVIVNLSVASGPEGITADDLMRSTSHFAAGEGLDLLLEMLARHGVKATVAVPAVTAACWPERIRAIHAAGHEIAALGFKGEDVSGLPRAEEQARIELTTRTLAGIVGVRPQGWFSLPRQRDRYGVGTISPSTMELLLEAGFAYMGNGLADDIPHYWVTDFERRSAILTLPYNYGLDDQYFCMFPVKGTGLENSDMLARNWRAELDAQYKRGRCFTMILHPQHAGWCNRLALLDRHLAHMTSLPQLWIATGAEIARHWLQAFPAATHLKLEPSIWQDYPGSLS